ncbi:hypothetical protein HOLleu_35096 [Holothuria leucospilota]|uniref:Uncharacterized protein n=1 Tax=Holothuria leucospilota TaxID=206669 RepID=A0A9Q0YM58_HOLLE|nr:hypothetical protein HOLleu_35096 [Holothuria leucospilota]
MCQRISTRLLGPGAEPGRGELPRSEALEPPMAPLTETMEYSVIVQNYSFNP